MALSRDNGKTGGKTRWARERVQPTNTKKTSAIGAGMSKGRGNIGSLSELTRKTHKGSGNKGTTASLVAGTKKTGPMPRPSMMRGPLRKG